MKITDEFINSLGTFCCYNKITGNAQYSWKYEILRKLGVKLPYKKGWKQSIIGKPVPEELIENYNNFITGWK